MLSKMKDADVTGMVESTQDGLADCGVGSRMKLK
jgi:hypothetical protein